MFAPLRPIAADPDLANSFETELGDDDALHHQLVVQLSHSAGADRPARPTGARIGARRVVVRAVCSAAPDDRKSTPYRSCSYWQRRRMLSALAAAGVVPQPVMVQINFFCDLMTGPTPRRCPTVRAMRRCSKPRSTDACIPGLAWATTPTSSSGTPTWSSTRSTWQGAKASSLHRRPISGPGSKSCDPRGRCSGPLFCVA